MMIPWLRRSKRAEPTAITRHDDTPLGRWRALLHWAAQAPFYLNHRSFLKDLTSRGSLGGMMMQFGELQPVALSFLLRNPGAFRSGNLQLPAPALCSTFWEAEAKIALVQPWFRTEEPARVFTLDAKKLNRYGADVLVASPGVLMKLAETNIEAPARGIVAVHAPGMRMMREADRDRLWARFKVPVYQQLRGFQGELLAAECDAQVGFHANEPVAYWEIRQQQLIYTNLTGLRHPVLRLATGWYGDLEKSRCGCGSLSPRIFPFERQTEMRNSLVSDLDFTVPQAHTYTEARA